MPGATIGSDQAIYDLKKDHLQKVLDLNIIGTILPTQVFSEFFAKQKNGVISISLQHLQSVL